MTVGTTVITTRLVKSSWSMTVGTVLTPGLVEVRGSDSWDDLTPGLVEARGSRRLGRLDTRTCHEARA